MFGATSMQPREGSAKRRTENLAYIYQQILTVIVRVRQNRQAVADANAFRANIQAGLRSAEKDAVKKSYAPDDIRNTTLAVVAFLDESILNSGNPVFSSWHSMPLQEEMFGHHVAGETFFDNLDKLLSRQDSHEVADVVEVYALCLLMGYRGRYGLSGPESTRPLIDASLDKIRRIRGPLVGLSPNWAVPEGGVVIAKKDRWVMPLAFGALGSIALGILLFIIFKFQLFSGASTIHSIAPLNHP
ncbi:MAG TPA: DotU family type IV/VI secretion system protein [Candidatus Acidoferrum sp.]|nr:DotU family type IV/VI secretion system protein [Candidatus Acidoferrum sp.]